MTIFLAIARMHGPRLQKCRPGAKYKKYNMPLPPPPFPYRRSTEEHVRKAFLPPPRQMPPGGACPPSPKRGPCTNLKECSKIHHLKSLCDKSSIRRGADLGAMKCRRDLLGVLQKVPINAKSQIRRILLE